MCYSEMPTMLSWRETRLHHQSWFYSHLIQLCLRIYSRGFLIGNQGPNLAHNGGGGRYSVQKTLLGHVTNMGSKINLQVSMTPYFYAKFGIWMGGCSKFSQIWVKICWNLKQFERKLGNFCQNLAPIQASCIWMGHFFFKNWYLGPLPNFHCHVPTKTKVENSPGAHNPLCLALGRL